MFCTETSPYAGGCGGTTILGETNLPTTRLNDSKCPKESPLPTPSRKKSRGLSESRALGTEETPALLPSRSQSVARTNRSRAGTLPSRGRQDHNLTGRRLLPSASLGPPV